MAERWVVVGGGFRGIIGAYLLASQGKEVVLLDGGKNLGGVLNSTNWKGFYLDKGCHLFDNSDDKMTAITLDILGDNVAPVSVRYASITNGIKADELAIPNLEAYGPAVGRDILHELVEASVAPDRACANLQQRLDARFGTTAGRYLAAAACKMYRAEPVSLEAESFRLTPFRRIKFVADPVADVLKGNPILDDRVASSSQSDPMRFYRDRAGMYPHRNFYPKAHGLRGFCEQAQERLSKLGVSVLLGQAMERLHINSNKSTVVLSNGEEISGDRMLWTSGLEALEKFLGAGRAIAEYIHHVPMVLHYFVIEKSAEGPYTYVQNFDLKDYVFRASVPGSYVAGACPEGLSYVCCEVPTTMDSPEWHRPEEFAERAWGEIQRHGVVRADRPVEALTVKVPTSYWMPKVGYGEASKKLAVPLKDEPRFVRTDDLVFAKNDIISSLLQLIGDTHRGVRC